MRFSRKQGETEKPLANNLRSANEPKNKNESTDKPVKQKKRIALKTRGDTSFWIPQKAAGLIIRNGLKPGSASCCQ
jgi:hypothetical protein